MTVLAACWLLFGSALLSATILPGTSEAVLLGLLANGAGQPALLIAVASVGNILGSLINWGMGRFFQNFKDKPWFPLKDATNQRAQAWFARYGIWSLLLSWVPVVGDPLTLVAGIMRVPIWRFLIFVSIGKVLRYTLVVLAWQAWST